MRPDWSDRTWVACWSSGATRCGPWSARQRAPPSTRRSGRARGRRRDRPDQRGTSRRRVRRRHPLRGHVGRCLAGSRRVPRRQRRRDRERARRRTPPHGRPEHDDISTWTRNRSRRPPPSQTFRPTTRTPSPNARRSWPSLHACRVGRTSSSSYPEGSTAPRRWSSGRSPRPASTARSSPRCAAGSPGTCAFHSVGLRGRRRRAPTLLAVDRGQAERGYFAMGRPDDAVSTACSCEPRRLAGVAHRLDDVDVNEGNAAELEQTFGPSLVQLAPPYVSGAVLRQRNDGGRPRLPTDLARHGLSRPIDSLRDIGRL